MSSTDNCKKRRERIAALVLGELEPSAAQELRDHMRTCHSCQSFYSSFSDQERSLLLAFEQLSEELARKDAELAEAAGKRSEMSHGRGMMRLDHRSRTRTWCAGILRISRWAVAALFLISAGYLVGRVGKPAQPDMEQLAASVAPIVTETILAEVAEPLASSTEASCERLKGELYARMHRDVRSALGQSLAVYEAELDERLAKLVQLIEATRALDRQRVTKALERIEANRLEDKARLGTHLVSLSARVNKPMHSQPN
jgi:hypothetical protein